jgi:hypothetical protein
MATWRHAFSLSKEELRDSEPPGTVRLVGMYHLTSVILSPSALIQPYFAAERCSVCDLCLCLPQSSLWCYHILPP